MKVEVQPQVISRSPDVMSGAPVFAGTRVPVQTIVDYLAGGHPLDEFLDDFPTVVVSKLLSCCSASKRC